MVWGVKWLINAYDIIQTAEREGDVDSRITNLATTHETGEYEWRPEAKNKVINSQLSL